MSLSFNNYILTLQFRGTIPLSQYQMSSFLCVQSGRQQQQTVEEALYVIGKNVFGANVTDRYAGEKDPILKGPSGQIRSAWEWCHGKGLGYVLKCLILILNFIRVQSSKLPIIPQLLGRGLVCALAAISPTTLSQKCANHVWRAVWDLPKGLGSRLRGFFHQIRVRQPTGRKISF
jgi:hypothetical protein